MAATKAARARPTPFLRHGLPFVAMMVAGSVGLSYLLQGRKDLERVKDNEEWEAIAVSRNLTRESKIVPQPQKKHVSLEDELKALQQKVDIDKYENKPLPRELLKE